MKVLHYADCNTLSFLVPWLDLMLGLGERGVGQALLCRPGGFVERIARERGIETYTWQPLIASLPILSPGYASLVKKIRPDIVHTRLSSAARIAGQWGPSLGIPTVATFDKPAKAKYYRRIDHYISCAKWLKKYMIEEQCLPEAKIDVVYNSVELEKYRRDDAERKAFRAAHGIADNERVFAGLGEYVYRKAFDVLIRAFAEVCRKQGGLKLMLIGGGVEKENYIRLIGELGIGDRVIMPEKFLENVRPWLWASDYYVMPSRGEGFSIALLEVLATGLPVIVSDIPPFTEIIEDGVNGLVAVKDDVASFARAMEGMHEMDDVKRRSMADISYRMMEENFTNEAIVRQTVAVYEKMLSR